MDLATLIFSVIAAVAGVLAIVVTWWMALSTRVRERLAQDEPFVDIDLASGPNRPQHLMLECSRNDADVLDVRLDEATVHEAIGLLRRGPFQIDIRIADLPRGIYRVVSIRYTDRWGRIFCSEKAVRTTVGEGVFFFQTEGPVRVRRPRMGFREIWEHRHVV